MPHPLLLSGLLLLPATSCDTFPCSSLPSTEAPRVRIATTQSDKSSAKPAPPAAPATPNRQPAPKDRKPRPNPPAHLLM
jgi:hypothetical protein